MLCMLFSYKYNTMIHDLSKTLGDSAFYNNTRIHIEEINMIKFKSKKKTCR